MEQRLFVYGTLAPGRPNAHVLADIPGRWEGASVRGRLLAEGWGAAQGFPGLILDPEGEVVQGQLLSSHELSAHWERLDEFEGDGYRRVLVEVRLEDGSAVRAYLYALKT